MHSKGMFLKFPSSGRRERASVATKRGLSLPRSLACESLAGGGFLLLRYRRPIHMGLAQALELLPEKGVLGTRAIGVLIGDALGNVAHVAEELAIASDVALLQWKQT